ncbi:MAG: glutamine-hydrolyzing carbamoyl-phosphate synthase small subunit [Lachnospiraceae bacterium]|nr:glutamine-hydrolyzing carbamoyl-phosphate synthase small subunit [Lachnospiraceae bacterium]
MSDNKCRLILADGTEFVGKGFGASQDAIVELVFNTSMVGYQEIMSDPSYTDQAVVMTYPLIGNYGINEDDYETKTPSMSGFVVRDYNDEPSNFRSRNSLREIMEKYNIVGISDVDTRRITRHIRKYGSCLACITRGCASTDEIVEQLKNFKPKTDAVARVSTKEIYEMGSGGFHVVAIDCGIKLNIVRMLVEKGCRVTVVPWDTTAEEIMKQNPDGVFISNGPGDPTDVKTTIDTVKALIGKIPIFGICLGHQIISLAYGAKTYKLKFGHRGGNHPVKNLLNDKIEITSQNHSYAVDEASLKATKLEMTHINLLDNTIEGVRCKEDFVSSVQYHPESAPGPQDSAYLFDVFFQMMRDWKEGTYNA